MRSTRSPLISLACIVLLTATSWTPLGAAQGGQPDAFPGHAEVQDRLDAFAEHPWVTLHEIGASNEDRVIRLAEVVDPNGTLPVDERPVTLVLTQQHGNEPAGTPAALRLMDNITSGNAHAGWLANQVLLVVPMVNPDGAEANTRGNADGVDINRDHIGLETPEARAVHEAVNQWGVDVALDLHEYGGTGPGNPVPARTYDYDVLTLYPKHGNVRAPTLDTAKQLMYDGIWPHVREEGYSVNEYGEVTANGEPVDEIAGGPDPGILRNHYGLHNIAGLLVETRIDQHPNPFHPPERRIQANTAVVEAALEHVHENADRFVAAKEASRQLAVDLPADTYVEGETTATLARTYSLPNETVLVDTLTRHGIEASNAEGLEATGASDPEILHDTWHPLQGHAAAIFHPDSSRTVVNATPTGWAPMEEIESTSTEAPAPLGLGPLVAALALGLAVARRRWA